MQKQGFLFFLFFFSKWNKNVYTGQTEGVLGKTSTLHTHDLNSDGIYNPLKQANKQKVTFLLNKLDDKYCISAYLQHLQHLLKIFNE